jgi:hypothetical protein
MIRIVPSIAQRSVPVTTYRRAGSGTRGRLAAHAGREPSFQGRSAPAAIMCHRVRSSSDVSETKLVFSIPPHRPSPNFAPTWSGAPTDQLPIVWFDPKAGERRLDLARWGVWCRSGRRTSGSGSPRSTPRPKGSKTGRPSPRHFSVAAAWHHGSGRALGKLALTGRRVGGSATSRTTIRASSSRALPKVVAAGLRSR